MHERKSLPKQNGNYFPMQNTAICVPFTALWGYLSDENSLSNYYSGNKIEAWDFSLEPQFHRGYQKDDACLITGLIGVTNKNRNKTIKSL